MPIVQTASGQSGSRARVLHTKELNGARPRQRERLGALPHQFRRRGLRFSKAPQFCRRCLHNLAPREEAAQSTVKRRAARQRHREPPRIRGRARREPSPARHWTSSAALLPRLLATRRLAHLELRADVQLVIGHEFDAHAPATEGAHHLHELGEREVAVVDGHEELVERRLDSI